MEYKAEFVFYQEDGKPIAQEALNRLTDKWVEAVEAEGLWTGGGCHVYTRLDYLLAGLWIKLWGIKWLRKPLKEKNA